MKYPKKIQILGDWVTVSITDNLDEYDGEDVHGDYQHDKNLIRLRDQCPELMARTLLHEVVHALFAKSGWSEKLGHRTEESLCLLMENLVICYALKSSGKAVKWARRKS